MLKEILINNIEIIKYIVFYLIILIAVILMYKFKKEWLEKIYKHRYWTGIIILAICVMFEISGSSIGMWKQYINNPEVSDGVILGESRGIRSDEWAVNTPMAFSQKFNDSEFPYFSTIIRGALTDVFIVYGQPTWNIVSIYRPFQLGYLFLGIAKGLSFFLCS